MEIILIQIIIFVAKELMKMKAGTVGFLKYFKFMEDLNSNRKTINMKFKFFIKHLNL